MRGRRYIDEAGGASRFGLGLSLGRFMTCVCCLFLLSCAQGKVPGESDDARSTRPDAAGVSDIYETPDAAERDAESGDISEDSGRPEPEPDAGIVEDIGEGCEPASCESLGACGEVSDGCGSVLECEPCPDVERVSIFGSPRRVMQVQQSLQLDVEAQSAAQQAVFCEFQWTSLDPSVARVDSSGRVSALKTGITEVRAECRGASDSVRIYVNDSGLPERLAEPGQLSFWLRADAGLSFSSAAQVKSWEDISGHGRRFISDDFAEQPRHVNNGVSGKPIVRFSGRQQLELASGTLNLAESSVFIVFKNNDAAHRGQLLAHCADGARSQVRLDARSTGLYLAGEASGLESSVTLSAPTTEYQVLTIVASAERLQVFQDGAQQVNQGVALEGAWPFSRVGARCTAEFLKGDIAEMLAFKVALDQQDRELVQAYLQARYQL